MSSENESLLQSDSSNREVSRPMRHSPSLVRRTVNKYPFRILFFFSALLFVLAIIQHDSTVYDEVNTVKTKQTFVNVYTSITVLNGIWPVGNNTDSKKEEQMDKNAKCIIPKLQMYNKEMNKFYKEPEMWNCESENGENWAESNMGILTLKSKYENATCSGRYLLVEQHYSRWMNIDFPLKMTHDAAELKCTLHGKEWTALFLSVVRKEDVVKEQNAKVRKGETPLSVYVLSFDSLSQITVRRNLPKTFEYLEKTMGNVLFNGYTTVGDGTLAAYSAILGGVSPADLKRTFTNRVKTESLIMEEFRKRGYMTLYAEDCYQWLASWYDLSYLSGRQFVHILLQYAEQLTGLFTMQHRGFSSIPSHHFNLPFYGRQDEKFHDLWYWDRLKCNGGEEMYKIWLRYLREFLVTYHDDNVPLMSIAHYGTLSHEDINMIKQADDHIRDHLQYLHEGGYFKNTVVMVMADHGQRYMGMRDSQQGQFEEKLPFFSLYFPEELRSRKEYKSIMSNLQWNSNVLTTHFDLHRTFFDLFNIQSIPLSTDHKLDDSTKALSLLRKIPKERNCGQAGLKTHFCPCTSWTDVSVNSTVVEEIMKKVISVFVQQTSQHRELCAVLSLKKMKYAKMLRPDEKLLNYDGIVHYNTKFAKGRLASDVTYQMAFVTTPGDAHYEVTLSFNEKTRVITLNLNNVSHISKYGDKPHCVTQIDKKLSFYCVCRDRV